jgi:hypothetical protein
MPNYGIWQEKDLALDALAAGVDREALLDAQRLTVAAHNAEVAAFVDPFADLTTERQVSVKLGATNRLQPLDENGRPRPVKQAGNYIVGFPLFKAGSAEGWNFWAHEQMTVQDFADSLDLMLQGDVNWVRDQLLSAAFYNGAGFAYHDDANGEDYTVYGPANGDATVYDAVAGPATDSHFSFQAAAIDSANDPFQAIYDDIMEHPVNAGARVVAFVSPTLVAALKLLPEYAPARDLVPVVRVVPAAGSTTTEPLVSPPLPIRLASTMQFVGTVGNVFVVSWQSLAPLSTPPVGYIIALAVGARVKPLAVRQYPVRSLQGLVNIGEPMSRFPYQQNNYLRALGAGARNRVGMFVMRVGSGSYAGPTALTYPVA